MANTVTAADNVVTKWLADFFREFIRGNLFAPYTGTGSNNPIVIKQGRKIVSIPLVAKLSGDGVEGSATLSGNEEILANFAYTLTPTYKRNGVRLDAEEREKPAIDLMQAAREMLMSWGHEKVRDDTIKFGLGSLQSAGTIVTVANTDAEINTTGDLWIVDNSDRVLYGAVVGNLSAGDHSASLANVDTTADQLTGDIVRLVRKIARSADPIIRPINVKGNDGSETHETYVLFVGTHAMLKLKEDLETLHSDAGLRGDGNPLFRPGDLIWDNVVIREIPEITTIMTNSTFYATAGASNKKVEPCFLCGAQAVGYGLGQKPKLITDMLEDYKFQPGVAVELKHEIDKFVYNSKDHGMVSLFVAGE